jgi:uncharacterized protein (DUF433 family)
MERAIPGYSRITCDPEKMSGQPCIRGTRLTVRRVLKLLATYPDRHELFREFPELNESDLAEALSFAASRIEDYSTDAPLAH